MKLYRNLLIPIVLLAVLVGAVWFFTINKPTTPPKPIVEENKMISIFTAKENEIKKVAIKFENILLEFASDKDEFLFLSKPKIEVAVEMLSSITYEFSNISALKLVTEKAIDLKDFGFNNPYTLTITLKNNKTREFDFGKIATDSSGIYFRENGSRKVYLMDLSKANIIFSDPATLMNLTLFKVNANTFLRFKNVKDGKLAYEINTSIKSDWRMTAPFIAPVRTLLIQDFYTKLAEIKVDRYLSGAQEPMKAYGLDQPKYTLTFVSKNETVTIHLGLKDANGMFYGRLEGSKRVFLINSDKVGFVDMSAQDIMLQIVNIQDISNLNNLKVAFDGHSDKFDITYINKKDKNIEKYIMNGQDVTNLQDENAIKLFKAYYEALLSIAWYEIDLNAKPKLGVVDMTLEYFTKDNSNYKIEFSRKDNNYYYAFKNGIFTGLVVEKDQFITVKKARAALIKEAKQKNLNLN